MARSVRNCQNRRSAIYTIAPARAFQYSDKQAFLLDSGDGPNITLAVHHVSATLAGNITIACPIASVVPFTVHWLRNGTDELVKNGKFRCDNFKF